MRRKLFFTAGVWLITIGTAVASISTREIKRLQSAASVIGSMREQPDGIPDGLWQRAACVVVVPDLKKAALGIGGEYGKGVMSCRVGNRWSAPAFMELAQGSWGLQIGAAEVDVVLLVMNREGAEKLLKNKVNLGADASIAAGPIGRAAAASTDAQLTAEVLSYSRAKGIFAGVDISGGVLGPDKDANTDVYRANADPKNIALGKVSPPREADAFLKQLNTHVVGTTGK